MEFKILIPQVIVESKKAMHDLITSLNNEFKGDEQLTGYQIDILHEKHADGDTILTISTWQENHDVEPTTDQSFRIGFVTGLHLQDIATAYTILELQE